MPTIALGPELRTWTAPELRRLPPEKRNEVLSHAAELADEDYTLDSDLTAFEAFGREDLHGSSSDTE